MRLSISTANLYMLPFARVLSIYRAAGYRLIELAGYWRGGPWEVAQHLKGVPPADAVKMVRDAGLSIATYHDMGGLIGEGADSAVAPDAYEYLECADIPCVVLHAPHKRGADADWWRAYRKAFLRGVAPLAERAAVCVENMPPIPSVKLLVI
jgi:sugar phosphate isomerase/epimerase